MAILVSSCDSCDCFPFDLDVGSHPWFSSSASESTHPWDAIGLPAPGMHGVVHRGRWVGMEPSGEVFLLLRHNSRRLDNSRQPARLGEQCMCVLGWRQHVVLRLNNDGFNGRLKPQTLPTVPTSRPFAGSFNMTVSSVRIVRSPPFSSPQTANTCQRYPSVRAQQRRAGREFQTPGGGGGF